ncbi:D-alanyl-D-alanine carboxypeptidase / D-alanyl-D-alanine-endopeptidase (penicillin-binding protein 4) [Amycolatopsis marina]|uniref:D-alanyl-D-alanine carboxypeptidase / D-alanyl-D-alanine-endopeptidase (Penicillin-binding protein 4) n=1 Tax=Amycolatopsis marina TaxID=490629 RepID=A0A1I0Y744_9PSEU|nr:D-alanyl-D-alanine carboxypeptidase/D-alanyl-D-alanine-endopeptidase [Amycolatopsis marina]SFB09119.1 D-alanyl-D-alanine carboxypeptidase / D-alanyl-D-alanine-endopeptidase (penicillin-binding protein 4) [Amycolatopsis marina]
MSEKDGRFDGHEAAEPAWPSADSDLTGSQNDLRGSQSGATHELPVPKVTPDEPATVWVTQPPPRSGAPTAGSESVTRPHRRPPPQQQPPPQPQQQPRQPPPQPPPPQPRPQPPAPVQRHQDIPPATTHAVPMRIEPGSEPTPAPATKGDPPRERPGVESAAPEQPATAEQGDSTGSDGSGGAVARPRRRRRGLLVGALALILVVAVGVTLALPSVANRLALPWAPNAPKGEPPEPVAVTRTLQGPDPAAPAASPSGVAAALQGPASAAALGDLTGNVVDPASGEVLWEQRANEVKTPASTTKILAAAAALLELDHGMQIPTRVVEGDEPGTVVVVAGGDVTLTGLRDDEESLYPGAARLDDLVNQVKEATGGAVDKVAVDLSIFAGPTEAPSWDPADAPSTFAAPVEPVMLDGGRQQATDPKSQRHGDPAAAFAGELAERLGAQPAPGAVQAGPDARVLGEVLSPPLTELVDAMLTQSDNLLADVIARHVAIATGVEPSFTGGAQATLDVLARNDFDVSGVKLSDDSGLSPENKVAATLLSEVLSVAAAPTGDDPRTAKLRPVVGGLPVAGGSGTLEGRYDTEASDQGKGWVRAKTGTLSGVSTLAGVVLDKDGRLLVFSLMSSGTSIDAARPALDAVAATLRDCGCR